MKAHAWISFYRLRYTRKRTVFKLRRLLFDHKFQRIARFITCTVGNSYRTCKLVIGMTVCAALAKRCTRRNSSRNRQNVRISLGTFCIRIFIMVRIVIIGDARYSSPTHHNIADHARIIACLCLNAKVLVAIYLNCNRITILRNRRGFITLACSIRCFNNRKNGLYAILNFKMTKDNLRWTVTKLYGYRNRRPSTCSYFINLMVIVQGKCICFRPIGFFKEFFGNLTYKVFRMKLLCAIYFHFFGCTLNVLITVELRCLLFYNNLNRFNRGFIHTIPRADRTCKDPTLAFSCRIQIV